MDTTRERKFADIVLWIGKPLFKPYFLKQVFSFNGAIIPLTICMCIPLFAALLSKRFIWNEWNTFFAFIGLVCIISIIQISVKLISYRNTKYWITEDAVYIQKGMIRPVVVSIKKNKILSVDIKKSRIEKKHGAGTIVIDDGQIETRDNDDYKVYKYLEAIKDPEEAVRLL